MARAAPRSPKVVVTNRAALVRKYGTAGVARIEQAVAALRTADAQRGFDTQLVYLDRGRGSWPKVTEPADPRQNKVAIDGVCARYEPAYLAILGSWDVVPYQDLRNPVYLAGDGGDDDRLALGDLPYACDAPYGTSIHRFLGPTRVVGRIPDLTGATDPAYLLGLLRRATRARPVPVPDGAFAVSARVWKTSTRLTVRALLGSGTKVLTSPPKGPVHPAGALRSRIHLVNCHGNPLDPSFVGEGPVDVYADALHSRKLAGLRSGTVAAFECCYGAELYDPREIVPATRSIAHAYLAKGAWGIVASTTIAYGMPDDVAQADVLCRLFLEHVRRGASLGRAFLEARLGYLAGLSVADDFDKKTLAQFVLLGDPSIHPFAVAAAYAPAPRSKAARPARESVYAARSERRRRLVKTGSVLGVTMAFTVPDARPDARSRKLAAVARTRFGKRVAKLKFLRVHEPLRRVLDGGATRKALPRARKAVLAVRRVGRTGARVRRIEAVLAYEVDGQVETQILVSR